MEAKVDGRLDQKIVFVAEGVKRKSLKISFRSIKILQTILVRTLYKKYGTSPCVKGRVLAYGTYDLNHRCFTYIGGRTLN